MDAREHRYSFFTNRECEYFPCHPIAEGEDFNCLFCYCPLYMLGRDCGGNYRYTDRGVKDCSQCKLPHSPAGYDHVTQRFQAITETMAQPEREGGARHDS